MATKEVKAYPKTGWGIPFVYFFDSSVRVDNRAKNGRSTKSFIAEGLWKPVTENMQAGDYAFIQFGHNDEVATKATFTTEVEFQNNLQHYINETRAKKANPILITPVARRKFDESGRVVDTHEAYAALVRKVAAESNVQLIDLNKTSMALLQQMGADNSVWLFNHLAEKEHPNYPKGKVDDTHFNELGARMMAQLVLKHIRNMMPHLAEHIINK